MNLARAETRRALVASLQGDSVMPATLAHLRQLRTPAAWEQAWRAADPLGTDRDGLHWRLRLLDRWLDRSALDAQVRFLIFCGAAAGYFHAHGHGEAVQCCVARARRAVQATDYRRAGDRSINFEHRPITPGVFPALRLAFPSLNAAYLRTPAVRSVRRRQATRTRKRTTRRRRRA